MVCPTTGRCCLAAAYPSSALGERQVTNCGRGTYTKEGVPVCMGMVPMNYVRSEEGKGDLYRCRSEGCHLAERRGVRYCLDEIWENRTDNPRRFGKLRRESAEWRILYVMRQAVERVFKSLKQSRRLEGHCVRGLNARRPALRDGDADVSGDRACAAQGNGNRGDDMAGKESRVAVGALVNARKSL